MGGPPGGGVVCGAGGRCGPRCRQALVRWRGGRAEAPGRAPLSEGQIGLIFRRGNGMRARFAGGTRTVVSGLAVPHGWISGSGDCRGISFRLLAILVDSWPYLRCIAQGAGQFFRVTVWWWAVSTWPVRADAVGKGGAARFWFGQVWAARGVGQAVLGRRCLAVGGAACQAGALSCPQRQSPAREASMPCSFASHRRARPGRGRVPVARRSATTSGGQGVPVTGSR
ncbi:hypothetical protein SAMN04488238_11238 [Roseicitreum antarcticum]|uniref:Uncharacterized protein n=1 Tax=Roseicitreum antarcticum TaxID=564137 RepID=A0A1H3D8Y5_9RHOB|nr:hypothetical protein SAMN04488238_11238 [Roseicitreum antarcticum]